MTPSDATEPTSPTDLVAVLTSEGLIGMHQAALLAGQRHASTPTRWCRRGVRRLDGVRVTLEAIRSGGRLLTSKQAVLRFLTAQNAPSAVPVTAMPAPTRRRKSRASSEVEKYLNLTDIIPPCQNQKL